MEDASIDFDTITGFELQISDAAQSRSIHLLSASLFPTLTATTPSVSRIASLLVFGNCFFSNSTRPAFVIKLPLTALLKASRSSAGICFLMVGSVEFGLGPRWGREVKLEEGLDRVGFTTTDAPLPVSFEGLGSCSQ